MPRRAALRWRSRRCARRAGCGGDRQADAVKVARDASGQPSEALKRKLAGLGRPSSQPQPRRGATAPTRFTSHPTGKADYVYLRTLAKGQPLARGLQDALDETIAKLPIPKVMSYAARAAITTTSSSCVPRIGCWRSMTTPSSRHGARPRGRSRYGGPPLFRAQRLSIASAAAYEETLRAEGQGDREPCRAPRGDRERPRARGGQTRRSWRPTLCSTK
jgi:glycyl-tRNA synthetase beta chain